MGVWNKIDGENSLYKLGNVGQLGRRVPRAYN